MIVRRAQWRMGTLVEIGADVPLESLDHAFAAVGAVEERMSRFHANSDLARLNAAAPFEPVAVHDDTSAVLRLVSTLFALTDGAFDVALGRGRGTSGFATAPGRAWRTRADVALSLDGIAKGYAVDRAVEALRALGARCGWVNAGGDLRAFGPLTLNVERRAGRTPQVLALRDRAMATSEYGSRRRITSRAALAGRARRPAGSFGASVLAADCVLADAMTKAVAIAGRRALRWARLLDVEVVWRA